MSMPIPELDWDDSEQVRTYNDLVSKVKQAASGNGKVDEDLDWEIGRLTSDLYGLSGDQRQRITNELKKVQKMRIVRELFPDWVDDENDEN